MPKKCDIYAFQNAKVTHSTTMYNSNDELANLEQLTYMLSFKKYQVYIITSSEEKDNQNLITKATLILPPILSEEEKSVVLAHLDKLLTAKKALNVHFYVLNFRSKFDSLDIEYQKLKNNELDLIKSITNTYFAEKNGNLNDLEKKALTDFRTFDFSKILLEEVHSNLLAIHNIGTILVTNDNKIYELPETLGYHEISITVALARHYHNRKYLNYDINKVISEGNIIVIVNHLQVLVYRPSVLTNVQNMYLKKLKYQVLDLKNKYPEKTKSLITGVFVYTNQNTLGIMDFLEDAKALSSLTAKEVNDIVNETNKLYYSSSSNTSQVKR